MVWDYCHKSVEHVTTESSSKVIVTPPPPIYESLNYINRKSGLSLVDVKCTSDKTGYYVIESRVFIMVGASRLAGIASKERICLNLAVPKAPVGAS